MYDVIIIGAGLSGLAAGIRLAYFDKKVCIVEKHIEIGGLNSFYRKKGRWFDVGLHAMTNYTAKGVRSSPLGKLLKQLRFSHDDFRLCQQKFSEIRFPDQTLRFTNDFDVLRQEITDKFPAQSDGFEKLVGLVRGHDELSLKNGYVSARKIMRSCLSDSVLIDMLLCPLMYYGNSQEHEMDFTQFVIMFKSIYMEGFAKPEGGMRRILGLMVEKYKTFGGELRLGSGVRSIHLENFRPKAIKLSNGETLEAEKIISSIGYVETMKLCDSFKADGLEKDEGQLSFMESQYVLNCQPKDLGLESSIVFFNNRPKFEYRKPNEMVDLESGVICCANNFSYSNPTPEGLIRFTFLANPTPWFDLTRSKYKEAKREWEAKCLEAILKFMPDFRKNVLLSDTFTPKTIKKFTGHLNGAVYGSPVKRRDGRTPIENLFICGTDQGFLGIIGATLSGITVANLYGLKAEE